MGDAAGTVGNGADAEAAYEAGTEGAPDSRDQFIWHFAADKKEVIRITGEYGRFAYAKGPAWKADSDWQEVIKVQGTKGGGLGEQVTEKKPACLSI